MPERVWLVTDVYPPGCGGSGWSTHALARTLLDRGHDVEVFELDPGGHGLLQRRFDGVRVTEVGVARARRSPRRRLGADDYALKSFADALEARIVAAGEDGAPKLLHGQHLHSGPAAVHAGLCTGVPTVVTVRDYWPVCLHGTCFWGGERCPGCSVGNLVGCMNEYWRLPRPAATVMVPWARRRLSARRRWLLRAGGVVIVSEATRQRVLRAREWGGLERPGLDVVPNIVERRAVEAAAERAASRAAELLRDVAGPFWVAAGKLTPTKGFRRLLESLAVLAEDPDVPANGADRWTILIAGTGTLEAELRRRAASLAVEVRFLGWVEHDLLLALLRESRGLVLPSAWDEPLSRLLLEGMALGAPAIAWPTGGTPEVVEDGVNGWLVQEPRELAHALTATASEDARNEVAEAARRTVDERFSPASVYPRILATYRRAVEAARRDGIGERGSG